MDKKPLPPGFQARAIRPLELPDPSTFRQLRPAVLGTPPVTPTMRLFERRRLWIGIGIAVAFHASLGLAWWLAPPLRLKAGIDPHRWVQVVSLPKPDAAAPPLQPAPSPPPSLQDAHKAPQHRR